MASRSQLTRSQNVFSKDYESADAKFVLKYNLQELIAPIDNCTCPLECDVPEITHSMWKSLRLILTSFKDQSGGGVELTDIKCILKESLKELLAAIEVCHCPSRECSLQDSTHHIICLCLQMVQEIQATNQQQQATHALKRSRSIYEDHLNIPFENMAVFQMEEVHEVDVEETDHAQLLSPKQLSQDSGYGDHHSASCSIDDDIECHVGKGYLLLINNIWFHRRNRARNKAEEEGKRMEALFLTMGFKVNHQINKSKQEMQNILKDLAESSNNSDRLYEHDCFVCLIMSHGSKRGIHGTDDEAITLDEIINTFKGDNCKELIGKPKIFLFQSCRGNANDAGQLLPRGGDEVVRDSDSKIRFTVPTDSDILMVCSSGEGMVSKREYSNLGGKKKVESWFIHALGEVLEHYAWNEDLLKMLTRVNRMVARTGDENTGMQMPCQFSTLTRTVFLT